MRIIITILLTALLAGPLSAQGAAPAEISGLEFIELYNRLLQIKQTGVEDGFDYNQVYAVEIPRKTGRVTNFKHEYDAVTGESTFKLKISSGMCGDLLRYAFIIGKESQFVAMEGRPPGALTTVNAEMLYSILFGTGLEYTITIPVDAAVAADVDNSLQVMLAFTVDPANLVCKSSTDIRGRGYSKIRKMIWGIAADQKTLIIRNRQSGNELYRSNQR